MLNPNQLHDYQKKAVNFQCSNPHTMLWLDMGLGKTAVTLTSITHLIKSGFLRGVLIVAPIRVCRLVWKQEAAKWAHTSDLKFSMLVGSKDKRTYGLLKKADVYLVNYENLGWLAKTLDSYFIQKGKPLPFDGIVWDEISKMKNSTTGRVHAWIDGKRKQNVLDHFKWRTGLTGTPASNGYKDLHGQYLVVDGGERLGKFKTQFMTRWYRSIEMGRKHVAYHDTETGIKSLISDITLEMSAEDYNPLPSLIVNDVEVELPDECRAMYEQMEKDLFVTLENGAEIEVFNQASLTNKCLQFSNGAIYPIANDPHWQAIHDCKLDALDEILEESGDSPVLCSYAYRSDAERIMKRFEHLSPINLTECKSDRALSAAMEAWATGKCKLMIGHASSMGHGIDGLQKRGNVVVWFGLTWSLDLYDQMNARIRRQGQGMPVMCHRIVCKDTLDQAQMLALDSKAQTQAALRNAVKEYRKMKGH